MAVAQGHIMDRAQLKRLLSRSKRDEGGVVRVGGKRVHDAVGQANAQDLGHGCQGSHGLGRQVAENPLGAPRGPDQFHSFLRQDRSRVFDDVDMGRFSFQKGGGAVDGRRVQGVVVARQEIDRDRGFLERFQGSGDGFPVHLVGLEDVAADRHEPAVFFLRHPAKGAHGVETGLGETLLDPGREEAAGHAQLPVAGMEETDQSQLPCLNVE